MVATLRLVLIAFAMATVTIAPVVAQTPQTPVDPQHLVGEWAGKWSGIWGTGSQTLSGDLRWISARIVNGELFSHETYETRSPMACQAPYCSGGL